MHRREFIRFSHSLYILQGGYSLVFILVASFGLVWFGLGPALLFGASKGERKITREGKEEFSIDVGNRKISGSYLYMGLDF